MYVYLFWCTFEFGCVGCCLIMMVTIAQPCAIYTYMYIYMQPHSNADCCRIRIDIDFDGIYERIVMLTLDEQAVRLFALVHIQIRMYMIAIAHWCTIKRATILQWRRLMIPD